jgi:hypothetical protein
LLSATQLQQEAPHAAHHQQQQERLLQVAGAATQGQQAQAS